MTNTEASIAASALLNPAERKRPRSSSGWRAASSEATPNDAAPMRADGAADAVAEVPIVSSSPASMNP